MVSTNGPISVMMLGLRGFPYVQGGVEAHTEHLCSHLVALGCDVTVLVRSPSQRVEIGSVWKGVKFVALWAPRSSGLETVVHSFLGVLYASIKRPDILHIQAIGPALVVPLAKILGLRVVVTHHGPDYDREKWGLLARFILKLGERWGMTWANRRIVISKVISDLVLAKYGEASVLIPNGVDLPQLPNSIEALKQFDLTPGHYVLLVSRLVPEKRHLDLIAAFKRASLPDWKLVIIGDINHPDAYQREVMKYASEANVVIAGFQYGLALEEIYANAGLFVLPSSHEGLSIVLLEALSYGLKVIASDIPANLEVGLPVEHYFPLGDISVLADLIRMLSGKTIALKDQENTRAWVAQYYDWQDIAEKTLKLYEELVKPINAIEISIESDQKEEDNLLSMIK